MGFLNTFKELFRLVTHSKKIWLIPVFLFLVIIALLVIGAQVSPVTIFLYPVL